MKTPKQLHMERLRLSKKFKFQVKWLKLNKEAALLALDVKSCEHNNDRLSDVLEELIVMHKTHPAWADEIDPQARLATEQGTSFPPIT